MVYLNNILSPSQLQLVIFHPWNQPSSLFSCYLWLRSPCWLDRFVHLLKVGIWILVEASKIVIYNSWHMGKVNKLDKKLLCWTRYGESTPNMLLERHESSFSLWRRWDAAQGPQTVVVLRMVAVGTNHPGFPLPTPSRETSTFMTHVQKIGTKTPAKHPAKFKFGNPWQMLAKLNWKTPDKCWGQNRIPNFPIHPVTARPRWSPRLSNKAGARPLQLPAAWSAKGTSFRLARLPKGNCLVGELRWELL